MEMVWKLFSVTSVDKTVYLHKQNPPIKLISVGTSRQENNSTKEYSLVLFLSYLSRRLSKSFKLSCVFIYLFRTLNPRNAFWRTPCFHSCRSCAALLTNQGEDASCFSDWTQPCVTVWVRAQANSANVYRWVCMCKHPCSGCTLTKNTDRAFPLFVSVHVSFCTTGSEDSRFSGNR